jgi:glycosyltransferase involved in cell wall biosynthesis
LVNDRTSILILVENLPVPLDRRVWQEACALRDAGYHVIVICPRMRGYMEAEEVIDGIQIYRHWISEEAGGFAGFFREYLSALWGETRLAWKAWRHHRFKLLHLCNPPDLLFLVALPFKILFGVKVVYDIHDLWPEMFEAKFGKRGLFYRAVRLAERMTYLCADLVLATNESVRQVALTRGGKAKGEVFLVRTAPKIAARDYQPDPTLKKGRAYLVGYVGVMGNADGVDYLIDAAAHLVDKLGRTDVQFLLMGTGPEHPKLVEHRDRLGLQQYVDLPGRVSNDFLFAALQTIDVGVSCDPINAYNNHCTMNKVLEYMAFAKPQVLFDLEEGRQSAGDAAIYVSENSAEELAEAIGALLDNPVARASMGRRGEERIRTQLNWERSERALLQAYDVALCNGRGTH